MTNATAVETPTTTARPSLTPAALMAQNARIGATHDGDGRMLLDYDDEGR